MIIVVADERWQVRKEAAPCCVAQRDEHGRLPIGFCGPDCIRRPSRQAHTESLAGVTVEGDHHADLGDVGR